MGLFDSFAEMNGLTESTTTVVDEAAILEEMEKLEEMEPANLVAEDPYDACFEAMLVNEKNYSNIMMAIAHEEMSYFVENGEEMVYESGRLSAVFDRLRDLIDKAWTKIKAIFEKVLKAIDSWVSTDKRFVEKHKSTIEKADSKAFEISDSYQVNYSKIADLERYSSISKRVSDALKAVENGKIGGNDSESYKNKVTEVIYGAGSGAEQYRSTMENKFGIRTKTTVKNLDAATVISELKEGKENKKNVRNAYKDAKNAIASMKRNVEAAKRDANKDKDNDNKTRSFSYASSLCSTAITALHTLQSVQIKAMNVHHSNCRKAAARCVRGVKSTKESADFFDENEVSVELGGSYSYIQ